MKRIIALCFALFLALSMFSCVKSEKEDATVTEIELNTEEPTVLEDETIGNVEVDTLETEEVTVLEDVTVLDGTEVAATEAE